MGVSLEGSQAVEHSAWLAGNQMMT